jgi:hypothetical protein
LSDFWLALAGEIQQSFRRMKTHGELIATSVGGLVPPRPALDAGSAAAFPTRAFRAKSSSATFKTFDTSGKSPAYLHHRKNSKSPRRGNPAAGFFNPYFPYRPATARYGATSSHAPLPEASQAGRRSNLQLVSCTKYPELIRN